MVKNHMTGAGAGERVLSAAQLMIHGQSGRKTRIEATGLALLPYQAVSHRSLPQFASSKEFDMLPLQLDCANWKTMSM